jgi:uncharacterized protein (DUF4415 family)
MLFEWDERKRETNLAKHLIDFQDAGRVFDGPVFESADSRHGEDRIIAIGLMEGIEIVVVYVVRGKRRRIIRQGGQIGMKGKITQTTSEMRTKGKTDFTRLRQMRDGDIDYSDIPKLDETFWRNAKLTMPEPKDRVTIRLDHDVVEWLKKNGSGYQTRINAILRSYMNAQSGGSR